MWVGWGRWGEIEGYHLCNKGAAQSPIDIVQVRPALSLFLLLARFRYPLVPSLAPSLVSSLISSTRVWLWVFACVNIPAFFLALLLVW